MTARDKGLLGLSVVVYAMLSLMVGQGPAAFLIFVVAFIRHANLRREAPLVPNEGPAADRNSLAA